MAAPLPVDSASVSECRKSEQMRYIQQLASFILSLMDCGGSPKLAPFPSRDLISPEKLVGPLEQSTELPCSGGLFLFG